MALDRPHDSGTRIVLTDGGVRRTSEPLSGNRVLQQHHAGGGECVGFVPQEQFRSVAKAQTFGAKARGNDGSAVRGGFDNLDSSSRSRHNWCADHT